MATSKKIAQSKPRTKRTAKKPIHSEAERAAEHVHRLPAEVTIDREWLGACIDMLDVHKHASTIMREVSELAESHKVAFDEQRKSGLCSERAASLFSRWGFEAEHNAFAGLSEILASIQSVVDQLKAVAYPPVQVKP